jgi:hypothetical protein
MRWSYEIVPVGGHQRLAAGSFDAGDIEVPPRPGLFLFLP